MRTTSYGLIVLLTVFALPTSVAHAAPASEEPKKEAAPAKATPTPATARKAPAREAAPPRTEPGKTDPRGLQVEPVDFKKAPEKPKPK